MDYKPNNMKQKSTGSRSVLFAVLSFHVTKKIEQDALDLYANYITH